MHNPFKKAALAVAVAALAAPAWAAPVDATQALPAAKPGECYAKVVVPAEYKTENVELTMREASVKIETVPAEFETVEEQVLVKEAGNELVPVPAEYETAVEAVELSPAARVWVAGRKKAAQPASPALLQAIAQSGIKLEELPAGACLNEFYRPAEYKDEEVKVLKTEGYEKIEVEPAAFEAVEEQVLVKEASKKIVEVPAEFETVTEQVLVAPATTMWKAGRGLIQRIDNTTGEIMCLVEVPAKYETVERNVIKAPATVKEVEIPAEYKVQVVNKLVKPAQERRISVEPTYETLTKRVKVADEAFLWYPDWEQKPDGRPTGNTVCQREVPAKVVEVEQRKVKTPASVKEVEVPAEYKTVKVRKMVKPATENRIEIPAVVETVAKKVKVSDERLEWRSVLCETNMTPRIMTDLQRALKAAGYDAGPVDGQIGAQTLKALDDYQRDQGIERGGLTLSTLEALGVKI